MTSDTKTRIALTVNGRRVSDEVAPRTHLADFLREHLLLTGTHIGCEHGICGACTVTIDGDIARSCITYAVACDGADIRTIEGYDDDALMAHLRSAFTAEHALQCGYCTPGMLVAARDLVRRRQGQTLSRADIRHEMSGNLCRCTGYVGIVSAIERVMREPAPAMPDTPPRTWLGPAPGPGAQGAAGDALHAPPTPPDTDRTRARTAPTTYPARPAARAIPVTVGAIEERDGATRITQSFVLQHPLEAVWTLMSDPGAIARCLPGLSLEAGSDPAGLPGLTLEEGSDPAGLTPSPRTPSASSEPGAIPLRGRLEVSIGPVSASFAGEGSARRIDAEHRQVIEGRGGDRKSGSHVSGSVDYRLTRLADTAGRDSTRIDAAMSYTLAGPLAQIGRSNLARDLVRRLGEAFAANLDAQLTDPAAALPAARLGGLGLALRLLLDRLRALLRRTD